MRNPRRKSPAAAPRTIAQKRPLAVLGPAGSVGAPSDVHIAAGRSRHRRPKSRRGPAQPAPEAAGGGRAPAVGRCPLPRFPPQPGRLTRTAGAAREVKPSRRHARARLAVSEPARGLPLSCCGLSVGSGAPASPLPSPSLPACPR